MQNNTTLSNRTQPYGDCNINYETLHSVRLYTQIATSICSFVGNLLVILTVYRNNNLRTSTNYFIVNMSVSDIMYPFILLLGFMSFKIRMFSPLSNLVGNVLCKILPFISHVSYGVSMLTLVVIAVYRFSAVMFPLRARVQNKRKDFLVLLFTWVVPISTFCPFLVYQKFDKHSEKCFWVWNINNKPLRIWLISYLSLFYFFPLLIMLVLYPLIIIKLKHHKIPGNKNNIQAVIRRRRQNARLTTMFTVLTVAFLLCWGPYVVILLLLVEREKIVDCFFPYFSNVSLILTVIFHAINPAIYFIFLSSFRQGIKIMFRSSRCSRTTPQAPADNFELNNIQQGLHNN